MAEIKLTNRDFNVLIDDSNYEFLSQFSWYAKNSRWGEYACAGLRVGRRVLTIRMHRFIMRCFDDQTVDHLNGNHWDNRSENLEIVSMLENVKWYTDTVPF